MLKLAVIGFGAMAREMARLLQADIDISITQVIVPPYRVDEIAAIIGPIAPEARVLATLEAGKGKRPDAVVECAGHQAVLEHIIPALELGIPCVLASVGALHDEGLRSRIGNAAARGGTRVQLISGAMGAIDALAAAAIGGLDQVTYVARKPPRAWIGTAAEDSCDLSTLVQAHVIFKGSARDAALKYPQNANVAATVALAGVGLDRTQVELIADPDVQSNVHSLVATGTFGRLELRLENRPLSANPKTSAMAVYSLTRTVRNLAARVHL